MTNAVQTPLVSACGDPLERPAVLLARVLGREPGGAAAGTAAPVAGQLDRGGATPVPSAQRGGRATGGARSAPLFPKPAPGLRTLRREVQTA